MAATSNASELDPLDPAHVAHVLSHPPFVSVPGVHNVRDLGAYPTSTPGEHTRPGFMFRSGEISGITPEGEARLRELGITTVFDLRSDTEMLKYNTPIPALPEDITVVRAPVFEKQDYSPQRMAQRFELYASGKTEAFMRLYSEILEAAGPSFQTILRHVRDKPNESFLFHCTAGKDRTGILAAILLMLAGVEDETIAQDYALTRIGREPMRAAIMERLNKEPIFMQNPDAALNMFSSRHETMLAFLSMFRERYGGAEAYLKQYCGQTDENIAAIRRNIVVRDPDPDASTS